MTDAMAPSIVRKMIEAADTVTFSEQLDQEAGPVVLMNVFRFDPVEREALIKAWTEDAEFMKEQPGFVSAQIHEGHAGSNVLFNYAVWETASSLRDAVRSPGFAERISQYPASARSSPHVFRPLAIPGVCGDKPMTMGE